MAKQPSYTYGEWSLGQLGGEAVAVRRVNGRRERHRLGTSPKDKAASRSALIAFATSLAKEDAGNAGHTVAALWKLYEDDRERDGKDMARSKEVWKHVGPVYAKLRSHHLNDDVHRIYAQTRETQGAAAWTIWTELQRLRNVMVWAHSRHHVDRMPILWNVAKPEGRTRILTEDELGRLLEASHLPHLKLFMLLAITTGARHAAICELTWDRVNFETNEIDFRRPTTGRAITDKGFLKGRAFVPVGPLVKAALQDAKINGNAECPFVIQYRGKGVLNVTKAFRSLATKVGLGLDVSPHTFRHTAGTWAEAGAAIEVVAKLLGHSNPNTSRDTYVKKQTGGLVSTVISIEDRLKKGKA
jgi:integrase